MNDVHPGVSPLRVLRLALLTGGFVLVSGLPDSAAGVLHLLRTLTSF